MVRLSLWAKAGLVAISLAAASANAAQVVVVEVTYEHSAQTTWDSHYRPALMPATPSNWLSPINYAQGSVWVRLEVFTKPTDIPSLFQVCFEATPDYACTVRSPVYTKPGVYEWATPFSDFYYSGYTDWSKGTNKIALILKDTNNNKPSPENAGAETSAKYMPTKVRITVTLVTPGSTYVSPPPPATPVPDAGIPLPDAGHPLPPDAGIFIDAGAADAGSSEEAENPPVEPVVDDSFDGGWIAPRNDAPQIARHAVEYNGVGCSSLPRAGGEWALCLAGLLDGLAISKKRRPKAP